MPERQFIPEPPERIELLKSWAYEGDTLLARNGHHHNMYGHCYAIHNWVHNAERWTLTRANWESAARCLGAMRFCDAAGRFPFSSGPDYAKIVPAEIPFDLPE